MKTEKELAIEYGGFNTAFLIRPYCFSEEELNTFAQKWLEANLSEILESHNRLQEALSEIAIVNHSSAKCGKIAKEALAAIPEQYRN